MLLNNKKVFIIGGSGLIGKAIVKNFLKHKAKVYNLDLKNINIKNKKYFFEKFDVTDLKNTKKNFEKLIKKKGIPDIFINASYPRTKDWAQNNFKNIKLKSLQQNINMFMNSYVWSAKCIADKMTVNSKKKSIILVGSIYGKVGQNTFNYVGTEMKENYSYSIIKGGIDSATRQMASYYGKFNIRVNNLCPGALISHVAGLSKKQNKKFIDNFIRLNPIKRLGKADEVANVALFLGSDLSSYITGQSIYVDGGYTII